MLTTLFVFFLLLSVLILVHELGHFLTAKKFGMYVEEFGFGLPPRIWGKKIGETIYSINWLPIGGFVKLYGEDREGEGGSSHVTKQMRKRAFFTRPLWQRSVVLTAGVLMNFVLAIIVISYLFTQGVQVWTDSVRIDTVKDGSPAYRAGLKKGDIIVSVTAPETECVKNNKTACEYLETQIRTGADLIAVTKDHLGEEIIIAVSRNKEEEKIPVVPRMKYPDTEGPIGITITNFEEKKFPLYEAPFHGMKESVTLSLRLLSGITKTVWKLISFQSVRSDVTGPVGIVQLTGEAIKFGNNAVLELLGLLSLNLAIINILPFPALDGGRLMFILVEAATGKRVRAAWERTTHQVGMMILLILIFLVTVNDLVRIFLGK